jgi:hypothetical protein
MGHVPAWQPQTQQGTVAHAARFFGNSKVGGLRRDVVGRQLCDVRADALGPAVFQGIKLTL